jgi:hypothetical protein
MFGKAIIAVALVAAIGSFYLKSTEVPLTATEEKFISFI